MEGEEVKKGAFVIALDSCTLLNTHFGFTFYDYAKLLRGILSRKLATTHAAESKSARPKTLDETIELANDLMDQKLRTYAER
ncbi:hypothetical protein Tco_0345683 [Tanacetum coccineum]